MDLHYHVCNSIHSTESATPIFDANSAFVKNHLMPTQRERTLNRTERLFAIILMLQGRPNLSSKDLANHFEVSRRTIFRDLRALGEAGVPLTYADAGGYEILEGYQLPPLMLTAREAATLLVATEFVKLQPDASLRTDADKVALKIQAVLPETLRDYVDRLQRSTVLNPYWLNQDLTDVRDDSGRWFDISNAITEQRSLMIDYFVPSRGESTTRTVNPLGLVYYSDHWNLIAFCQLRQGIRNFKVDRIEKMMSLSKKFDPPAAFDLPTYVQENGESDNLKVITLLFDKSIYGKARRKIPTLIESEVNLEEDGLAQIQVTFSFPNLDYLAEWLMEYGTKVKVISPPTLISTMKLHLEAVLNQYV